MRYIVMLSLFAAGVFLISPVSISPALAEEFCKRHNNRTLPECQRRFRRSTDKLIGKSKTRRGYCRYRDRRNNIYETRCRR